MDPILERYHTLEKRVLTYMPSLDTKVLFDAFTYADTAHHSKMQSPWGRGYRQQGQASLSL